MQRLSNSAMTSSPAFRYEREAIEGWMLKNMTSPMTRQQLTANLTPNQSLLRRIQDWEQAKEDFELAAALYESKLMVSEHAALRGPILSVKTLTCMHNVCAHAPHLQVCHVPHVWCQTERLPLRLEYILACSEGCCYLSPH